MSYAALLFCPDEKTSRVLSQVLGDLEFSVEACTEPFAAVKRLMAARFDAIVVDCDNEQNAALMFKSVRNSESNQSALTVAVVCDQAGVAKAFRLGANLVVTKPINVEQTKGTLRVARGLLKKSDSGKPAAATTAPVTVAASNPTASASAPATKTSGASASFAAASAPAHIAPPASENLQPSAPPAAAKIPAPAVSFPAKQAAATYNVPAISASAFELEPEPVPQPAPDDAALLESMPEPIQTNPVKNTWPAAGKAASTVDSHSGSAAAAAPAKEVITETVPEKSQSISAVALHTDTLVGTAEEYSTSNSASPIFSAGAGEDETGSGGSKTTFIAIAAVFAIAILGYAGYAKFGAHSTRTASSSSSSASSVAAEPAVQPDAIVVAKVPTATETAAGHASKASSVPTGNAQSGTSSQTNPVAPKNQKIAEDSADEKPQPLMVKTESAHPAAAADTSAASPAPPSLNLSASNADGALSGIISSVPVTVPKASIQTVKVSQGVSQGLLVKKVPPVYPPQALHSGIQGSVLLEARISKDGSIASVKAISGDSQLARAAVDAVRQWKYKPYFLDGQPIDIQTQVTVNFRLP
jgi:protein TonB